MSHTADSHSETAAPPQTGPPVVNLVMGVERARGRAGGRKVFVCAHEGCDKAYAVRKYLVEHERLHTGTSTA
jgi:hypothetical protein